jgi:RNA polymerase sporulation-specific sigma factor
MLGLIYALRDYSPEGGATLKTYAELCIKRRLYSAIKAAAGSKHAPLNDYLPLETSAYDGDLPESEAILHADFRREPEDLLIDKERSDEILSDFSVHLSGLEAEILGLYLKGLSYREIAKKINKPQKSVDNAVQRVRKKLAQLNYGDISQG